MSKITKALEKAARERLHREQEQLKAAAKATSEVATPLASPVLGKGVAEDQFHFDPHIVVESAPRSPIAEQYRILRTNLQSKRKASGAKVLLVTSAINGEGKSVTSFNLALSLAEQEGAKVLLLDADLRRGSIHTWLGLKEEKGLSTALTNGAALEDLVVRIPTAGLFVLPAGPCPEHPAQLLESGQMKRLMENLRRQFDVIVVDSPPLLSVADACILERLTDGTALVVQSGRTQRKTVLQAQALLKQVKAKLVGCILTHVEYYTPGYKGYYAYYRALSQNGSQKPAFKKETKETKALAQVPRG